MFEINNLFFSYKSEKLILCDISFNVQNGEILGIVGSNGTGKTTLLKNLCKLLAPQKGQIIFDGDDITKLSIANTAQIIAYAPQRPNDFFSMNVIDCVMMGRLPYSQFSYSKKDKDLVFSIIEKTNLRELAFRDIREISGGERQLVFIARALAQQPKIIILDEPTSSLDIKNQLFILHFISNLAKKDNFSIIMTLHDLNLASLFCDKILMLKNSRIFAYGEPHDILTEENIDIMYGVNTKVTEVNGYKNICLLK
ncbi:MAG: ABC transporter ATP-binding protein [Deltaproteobacteria bacterium]|jgi:iron complex transport system ATP-binding protein|nr:ABC transporter ATP-binding protein [Deltaproteobacteria bacterium]